MGKGRIRRLLDDKVICLNCDFSVILMMGIISAIKICNHSCIRGKKNAKTQRLYAKNAMICIIAILFSPSSVRGAIYEENPSISVPSVSSVFSENISDSLKAEDITLLEVEILSQKEAGRLQDVPASVSILSEEQIETFNITSIKEISSSVPNVYIPDYGTKLTSAVYIRGTGSRIGGSSVGFYVDDMPYSNQSAFDFDLFDIQNIEVLRGPQGTLYGRNSLGGIIHIHTLSPMQYQGTNVKILGGNGALYQGKLSHYQKMSDKFALAVGGAASSFGGFFSNQYAGKYVDGECSASARARAEWYLNPHLKLKYIINYDYSKQNGYAYGLYDKTTGKVADVNYNDPAGYQRNMLNNNLQLDYQARRFKITSTTTYQHLSDSMTIDQDFTPISKFALSQLQNLHHVSEEILLRSIGTSNFQWIAGAFGFYEHLNTNAPVTLKEAFIAEIEELIKNAMPFPIYIDNEEINVSGTYTSPTYGAAVFAQGTINHLFTEGLSVTAGVRLDYEKASLESYTHTDVSFNGGMSVPYTLNGSGNIDFMPLLPKFSIQYRFSPKNMLYASIARGYKSGGYNIQMFSDLLQSKMQKGRPDMETYIDLNHTVAFKPEYSWNYEVGLHSEPVENRLSGDISLFYININDQQIAEFSPQGTGRMIKNAGKSRSYGVEASLRSMITKRWSCNFAYGFTMAHFTDYTVRIDTIRVDDFSGNRVPFSPEHTLSVSTDYQWILNKKWLDGIHLSAQCVGNGNIYWTETNDIRQPFYALLNANISFRKKWFQLDLWGKNLTNTDYLTFYFETLGNPFAQKGKPMQFGASLSAKLEHR